MELSCSRCGSDRVQRRGTRRGKTRVYCNDCGSCSSATAAVVGGPQYVPAPSEKKKIESGEGWVFTSAQNNTGTSRAFESAKRIAEEKGYELRVLPIRYKNPTTRRDPHEDEYDEFNRIWWPDEVEPYLVEGELQLHPLCKVLGQVKVQATATNPLTGLEGISQAASGIVGHAQVAMRCIPTPQNALPKLMYTTGSISTKNYSTTKAGVMGDFHHSLGVVIVEKQGDLFHMRQLVGDTRAGFQDFDAYYLPDRVEPLDRVEAVILGDEHALFVDPQVRAGTFGEDGIVPRYRPKYLIRHDIHDSYSVSHHHQRDVVTRFVKQMSGLTLRKEMEETIAYLDSTTPEGTQNLIVSSNHGDHVMRWLNEVEWRNDLPNARMYHELWLSVLESAEFREGYGATAIDPFAAWAEPRIQSSTRFLGRDDHVTIKKILVSLHGDQGPNGARGSIKNLSKLGVRVIIGHGHSPGIEKGCYQVGTSAGRMAYQRGPGSNLATHCVITPNGKRILVHVIDGQHRAG